MPNRFCQIRTGWNLMINREVIVWNLLTSVARAIEEQHPKAAYVLNATAGAIYSDDIGSLQRAVYAWVKAQQEAGP